MKASVFPRENQFLDIYTCQFIKPSSSLYGRGHQNIILLKVQYVLIFQDATNIHSTIIDTQGYLSLSSPSPSPLVDPKNSYQNTLK